MEVCPSLQSPGSHFGTFPAETVLMRELEKVAVKVFTLYEMRSAVFMDTFRIRNHLHMLSILNSHHRLVEIHLMNLQNAIVPLDPPSLLLSYILYTVE